MHFITLSDVINLETKEPMLTHPPLNVAYRHEKNRPILQTNNLFSSEVLGSR
jgi:hypothetical protein